MSTIENKKSCFGVAALAAALVLMVGSPAAALSFGDLFDWLDGDGGDGAYYDGDFPSFLDDELDGYVNGDEDGETNMDPIGYGDPIRDGGDNGAHAVPEPTAALLFGVGAALVARARRRR